MPQRLFVELYLDEDVDVLLADLLKAKGYSALTVRKAGQRGKSDAEQLDFATLHDRALVTHNRRDFEALVQQYFEAGRTHAGVIIAVRRPVHLLAALLLTLLDQITADEMMNQVIYI